MKIKKLPNVLALHLKRFKYQEDVQKYIKLAYRVAFPLELRLFNTVDDAQDPDRLYELFAIVVHIGKYVVSGYIDSFQQIQFECNIYSGPHHGHYVTIIRTPANWLVFDDDTVEPIKESEIAKYFGESNSGSAYVLYYQAVDLDLVALGLRPPAPVSHLATVIPTQHSVESPVSHPKISPPLPPGLADEVDSDISDPPIQIARSQATQAPPIGAFVDKSASYYPLTVNVSPHNGVADSSDSPVGSPIATSSSGTKAGLFQSLRHSPSIKIRGQNSSGAGLERNKSLKEKIRRPSTSIGLPRGQEPPDLRDLPIPVISVSTNGQDDEPEKIKEPERKPSIWFKRKSGRSDKRPGTAIETSVLPNSGGDAASPSSSSTTTWFRYNTPTLSNPPKSHRHRPSEPALSNGGAFHSTVSLGPNMSHGAEGPVGLGMASHNGTSEGITGYKTPAPMSEASSLMSNSGPSTKSPIQRPIIYPLDSTSPSSPRSPIDHKRSQPQLKHKHKEHNLPLSPELPPRPSTAGGSTRRMIRASEPQPPLPSLPIFNSIHFRRPSHDQASDTTESEGRPTSYVTTDIDPTSGDLPIANLPSSATTTFRRASRKLSLTTPILGFGKDKHRERDKEAKATAKEKAREEKSRKGQQSEGDTSSTLPQFAVASRI